MQSQKFTFLSSHRFPPVTPSLVTLRHMVQCFLLQLMIIHELHMGSQIYSHNIAAFGVTTVLVCFLVNLNWSVCACPGIYEQTNSCMALSSYLIVVFVIKITSDFFHHKTCHSS